MADLWTLFLVHHRGASPWYFRSQWCCRSRLLSGNCIWRARFASPILIHSSIGSGFFSSDVELKRPPIRCECGSFNCSHGKCECGAFKPNTSSPLFILLSLCVILPRRHSIQQSTGEIVRRRSLFGRDRVNAIPKKSLSESLIVWNLCTGVVPLESPLSHLGLDLGILNS